MSAAIAFADVTRRYGATVAVDRLSFGIDRGEMFGVIGPDGAGKTTAIRLMCGLLRPDAGHVRVLGHDPVKDHRLTTASVGYLSQRFSLYGDLSIDENIAFFAEIHGVSDYQARRDRLLDLTQLTPFRTRLADQLSGGMKQKLALACTLVHEPQIIVLDEPTTGVDPVSRREFWKLLSEFRASGITIVMSTPYLDEAERCSRVVLLDRGRLLAADEPAALRKSLPGLLFELVVPQPRLALAALHAHDNALRVQVFGDRLHVWAPRLASARSSLDRLGATLSTVEGSGQAEQMDEAQARIDIAEVCAAAGVQPIGIRRVLPTLEDVFIAHLSEGSVQS